MKIKSRLTVSNEIPTSSMADIAFLLIVFFMVTTTFSARRGIDFRLPKQEASEQNLSLDDFAKLEATHIIIDPSGRLTVDKAPMNLEEIQGFILDKLRVNEDKFVIIQTDREATYGDMVDVLDELKQARVKNIIIPSKEEISGWADLGFF